MPSTKKASSNKRMIQFIVCFVLAILSTYFKEIFIDQSMFETGFMGFSMTEI